MSEAYSDPKGFFDLFPGGKVTYRTDAIDWDVLYKLQSRLNSKPVLGLERGSLMVFSVNTIRTDDLLAWDVDIEFIPFVGNCGLYGEVDFTPFIQAALKQKAAPEPKQETWRDRPAML